MVKVTVVHGAQFHELEVDPADGAEILKIQITSLTDLPPDKMLISGIGSGHLHDLADISALREGQLLTVTEGDATAIPHPQAAVLPAPVPSPPQRAAGAGAPAGDKIYGFLPSDVALLGPKSGTTPASALTSSRVLGLYFSAHWCPPCRGFTPKLAEAYQKIKGAGHAFEIVFVSSDKSEQQFAEYFATMPWLAMPLAMRDLKAGLSQMFGVRGIPALILLDGATGELISKDGRRIISEDPTGANFPWASAGSAAPAGASAAQAGGNGITLADLQRALKPKSAEDVARAQREQEQQRGMAEMQSRLMSGAQHVLIYEDKAVQAQALAKIPVDDIKKKAAESPGNLGPRDAVARHLLSWFKGYFSWVNNAPCEHCGSTKTAGAGGDRPNAVEKGYGAGVVELYKCNECAKVTRFPRYNHPGKLMETRKGRCGEWANAFTLCCIAMGFEARHTVDWTDHVWTEVFSEDQQRWIHCDACENSWDAPLLYSEGWGKKLTYVVAFSKEEIVDVTPRYTRQWNQCAARRTKCPELWLAEIIQSMRMSKLAALPAARRLILQARAEKEKTELAPRNYVKPAEPSAAGAAGAGAAGAEAEPVLPGRTTGSLEWRAARGEIGNGPTADGGGAAGGAAAAGQRGVRAKLDRSCVHGGSHDDSAAFDDADKAEEYLQRHLHVAGVTVWAGEGEGALVHGLQLLYMRKDGEKFVQDSLVEGPAHLAAAQACPPPRKLMLRDGEKITRVSGRSGALIDRVEFTIQTCTDDVCSQRVEAFGGTGGSPFSLPIADGSALVGFAGALGGHLHSIALYTYPDADRASAAGAGCDASPQEAGQGKVGCGTTVTMAPESARAGLSKAEEDKLRLQKLIRHFFFEIQKEGGAALDANAAAAQAIEKARSWLAQNGHDTPLPC